jgi:hypothetical protein
MPTGRIYPQNYPQAYPYVIVQSQWASLRKKTALKRHDFLHASFFCIYGKLRLHKEKTMEQFGRAWDLLKSCFAILRSDSELLLFPVISALVSIAVLAIFALPLIVAGFFEQSFTAINLIIYFLFYLCQSMVLFYFNAGLVGAALIRLGGGNPSFGDGIRVASAHIKPILGYAAVAATVGVLLRTGRKRGMNNTLGKMAGMAWNVATTLVIPLIVSRPIGPLDAIAESATLLKKTWGENIIGAAGIWAGFKAITFIYVVISVVVVIACIQASGILAGTIGIVALIGLMLLMALKSAISAIYTAVLYHYATEGQAPEGFASQQLDLAFAQK